MTRQDVTPLDEQWTTERQPGDDEECERLGCEDKTHPVHHRVPTLDAAWRAAEEALPEGWWIVRVELDGYNVEEITGKRERVLYWKADAAGPQERDAYAQGPTPALALLALAERLREAHRE